MKERAGKTASLKFVLCKVARFFLGPNRASVHLIFQELPWEKEFTLQEMLVCHCLTPLTAGLALVTDACTSQGS